MSAPTIGTIRGTIEIDYDGKGIIRAQDDLDGLGNKSRGTATSVDRLGTQLLIAGGVIAGGFAVATASAVSFEKQMSAVNAVSGASQDEMKKLSDKALQLGKDTQFSASEAGQAIEELVKAGLSVSDVLNGAADATVALAAAGAISLPEAATIAANAMNQFGLSAKDLNGVVDTIAGAANASAIDVNEFGFSLSQVGAVAHLAGQSFNETATAIALLGNAGIKGSDAGTSLKTFLSNLVPTTKKAKDEFKALGLAVGANNNAFLDAQGNYKDLSEIAGILQTATKGLSEGQKQVALETIFGSDAIRAAAVIAENGSEGFKKLNDEMAKSTAAEVAAKRMDNAAGSIEQLKGSAETLAITIGTNFLPALTKAVDKITDLVNKFNDLSPTTRNVILALAGVTGGLLLFGGVLIKTVAFFVRLKEAIVVIKSLTTVMKAWTLVTKGAAAAQVALDAAFVANPIGLIIVAIIALVAGIILLWKNSETFRNIVIGVWDAVKKAIGTVVDWLTGTAWPAIQKVWDGIVAGVQAVLDFLKPIWDGIVLIFQVGLSAIGAAFAVFKTLVIDPFVATVQFLGDVLSPILNAMADLFVKVFSIVADQVTKQWNVVKAVTSAVWDFISPFVMGAVNGIVDAVTVAWNIMSTVFTTVWNVISTFFTGVWDIMVKTVTTGVDNIGKILDFFKEFLNKVKGFFDGLKAAAQGGVGSLISFVGEIPGKILGALGDLVSLMFNAGKNIIQGLIDGIGSMFGKLKQKVSDGLASVRNLLPFSPAKEGPFSGKGWTLFSGMSLIEGFAEGITRASNLPVEAMTAAVAGVAAGINVTAPIAATAASSSPRVTSQPGAALNIGTVQVQGVWDFTDPASTRQMIATLDDELDKYKKGYK